MASESGKAKTAPLHAVPAKETLWEIVQDQGKQLELLMERLGIDSEELSPGEISPYNRYVHSYGVLHAHKIAALLHHIGHIRMVEEDYESYLERNAFPLFAGKLCAGHLADFVSFFPFKGAPETDPIISEYSVESVSEKITRGIENLRSAAEALVREFANPLARINRHTDLCGASRRLRETARANRDTPLYWALVDLDDCIRACLPEDMSQEMAETLSRCVSQLAVGMSEEEMLAITDALYTAGFRPWRPPRGKAVKRRKTADR
jgi:hypothetical protein